jgi:hypothetical protein
MLGLTCAPEGTRFLVLRDNHSATTPGSCFVDRMDDQLMKERLLKYNILSTNRDSSWNSVVVVGSLRTGGVMHGSPRNIRALGRQCLPLPSVPVTELDGS